MSVYTDIYNSGVAAYDTASQDKVTADQAIPVFYSTINSWSPFTTTQTDPQIIEIQRTMWATGLSMAVDSVSDQINVHHQRLSIDIMSLQNTITRANTALRNDKIFPDTLTNEEVANLTSGIAAINALIPQLQSTQNALNVVRAAAEAKYQQLTA